MHIRPTRFFGGIGLKPEIHSFIVRVWKDGEAGTSSSAELRGSIDDVATGKRLYFRDLEGILRFIREVIGGSSARPRSPISSLQEGWERLKVRFKHDGSSRES